MCTCCYLKGKKTWMLDARDFGVKAASEFHEKYVSQGQWTIFLDCIREMPEGRPREAAPQEASGRTQKAAPQEASGCKRCVERDGVWKQGLTANSHGCSACKSVFVASSWNAEMVNNHQRFNRDLVCPTCAERGYAPGKYDEHRCLECFEQFGSLNFDKRVLHNSKRQERSRLVCKTCQTKLRCGKCNTSYDLKYWSESERDNHASSQRTKLVCKECRAQGTHPKDLETYTCQTCRCKFGAQKFNRNLLWHHKYDGRKKPQCMQCVANAEKRMLQLRKLLQNSKRKCNCQCRIHREKCPLTPVIFGERRWPGSDGAISADDRKFLDELQPPPPWWSKAWGRYANARLYHLQLEQHHGNRHIRDSEVMAFS